MDISRKQARIGRVKEHIEESMRQMEEQARQALLRSNATARTRKAIEVAHRRYVLHQGVRVRNRFSPEQRRWMRLLLVDRLLENPHLHDKLRETVNQIRLNYGFEWVSCPFTAMAQAEARKIILMAAESEFGDTPMAGPLALVRYHHQQYKIRDITNYDESYLRAVRLADDRFFVDKGADLRAKLSIKTPIHEPAPGASKLVVPSPSES